ncbi:hypothetical protein DFP72DRAFT_855084 [Ephemerocybe angulata]|uniref:Uncharacterized protein n=1 Tax=Ephemerocybe angulata TaxID=980116 RepID=A0A8H6HIC2_9AGAR|nr:hypothetical protein DFP72DRAFT_855084 [Tulosesus angulatus]
MQAQAHQFRPSDTVFTFSCNFDPTSSTGGQGTILDPSPTQGPPQSDTNRRNSCSAGHMSKSREVELLERGLRGFGKNAFTTIAPAIVKMVGGHDYRKRPMPITRPIGFNKRPATRSRAKPAPLKWQGKPRELADDELSERKFRSSFKRITSPSIPPDVVKTLRGHPSRLPNVIRKPNGFPYSKHLGPAFRAKPAPRKSQQAPVKNQVKREISSEIDELD